MKIRPRVNPFLQVIDPACLKQCAAFCLLTASENPVLLALCILGCRVVCSD
jgi:hypothetical protein